MSCASQLGPSLATPHVLLARRELAAELTDEDADAPLEQRLALDLGRQRAIVVLVGDQVATGLGVARKRLGERREAEHEERGGDLGHERPDRVGQLGLR